MRLLLDADLPPKRIGSSLNKGGHDVVSLTADPALGAFDDPQVLELASQQDRILVTRNSRNFAPLAAGVGRTLSAAVIMPAAS